MKHTNRTHSILVRLNDDEKELLETKFKLSKCKSKSQFIRRMILDGVIVHFRGEDLKKLLNCFSSVSSNINQITVRVNSTGNLYSEDIKELEKHMDNLRKTVIEFIITLRKLKA